MTKPTAVPLTHRGVVRIFGADAVRFLQGIITQDAEAIQADGALWSAFLTPQGKYLHDFFALRSRDSNDILFECEGGERAEELVRAMAKYRLRASVSLETTSLGVWLAAEGTPLPSADGCFAFVDPRGAEGGVRLLAPSAKAAGWSVADDEESLRAAEERRIRACLPDGSRDFIVRDDLPADGGMDFLGGINFDKGCFLGQEITARLHYRGRLKRRFVPVLLTGNETRPDFGSDITDQEGQVVGSVRSTVAANGASAFFALAHLKPEARTKALLCNGASVSPQVPPRLEAYLREEQSRPRVAPPPARRLPAKPQA